jgi:hypothetical protein
MARNVSGKYTTVYKCRNRGQRGGGGNDGKTQAESFKMIDSKQQKKINKNK